MHRTASIFFSAFFALAAFQGEAHAQSGNLTVSITDPLATTVITPSGKVTVSGTAFTNAGSGTCAVQVLIKNKRTGLQKLTDGDDIAVVINVIKNFTVEADTPAGISGDSVTIEVTVSGGSLGGTKSVTVKF